MFLILSYSRLSSRRKDILSPGATRIEPLCSRAREPQILSPQATTTDVCEPAPNKGGHHSEKHAQRSEEEPLLVATREKPTKQEKTQHRQK